jgi:hypothetical protein
MDCRPESAATTLVRIETLVLQGLFRAVMVCILGIVTMPIVPSVYMLVRLGGAKGNMPWWKRLLFLPVWFLLGVGFAVAAPFVSLANGIVFTKTIVGVEWRERWRYGTMRHPDGRPLPIPDEEGLRLQDIAITRSVIEDYNDEAREHGQGILPVDE